MQYHKLQTLKPGNEVVCKGHLLHHLYQVGNNRTLIRSVAYMLNYSVKFRCIKAPILLLFVSVVLLRLSFRQHTGHILRVHQLW